MNASRMGVEEDNLDFALILRIRKSLTEGVKKWRKLVECSLDNTTRSSQKAAVKEVVISFPAMSPKAVTTLRMLDAYKAQRATTSMRMI